MQIVVAIAAIVFMLSSSLWVQVSLDSKKPHLMSFIRHDPISVDGDADLASQASFEGWPGNGSIDNPYVIGGFEIEGGSRGILISNVGSYFEVEDCYIHSSSYASVCLDNSVNGTLSNNSIEDSYMGIYLRNSPGNIIANNSVQSSRSTGIYLSDSNDCLLSNNKVLSSPSGIWLQSSDWVLCTDNIIGQCEWAGIFLEYSANSVFRGTNMTACGFFLYGDVVSQWNSHDLDLSNTANGKPVCYVTNQNGPMVIGGAGQVILIDCSGITVDSLDLRNVSIGIELAFCNKITVSNNDCSDNYEGVDLFRSNQCDIMSNNCSACVYGVGVFESDDNSFADNNCSGSGDGVYLWWSWDNTLQGNDFGNSARGVYMEYSEGNIVSMNRFDNCTHGVQLMNSAGNTFTYNNFTKCFDGIDADEDPGSDFLIISNNYFTSISGSAVAVWSDHDTISENTIVDAYWGIVAYGSMWLVCQGNTFLNSSLWVWGLLMMHWTSHTIDGSNTVNGMPVFYAVSLTDFTIPSDVGEIILADCSNAAITNRTFSLTSVSILMGFSTNISVVNNTFTDGRDGLYAYECDASTFSRNTFDGNDWAMDADYSSNNIINNNTFANCIGYAFGMIHSGNNTLAGNNFSWNGGYAIQLDTCTGNRIWNNSFMGNNGAGDVYDPNHTQAFDSLGDNQWYDLQPGQGHGFGNYWADWAAPDSDFDFIVDNPYVLDGDSGEVDQYPLTSSEVPNVQIPEFRLFAGVIALVLIVLCMARRRGSQDLHP